MSLRNLVITLCLTGLLGTGQSFAQLKVGYAKTDITPSAPVWMGGYDLRNAPSDGVWDKIYVRAIVFESGNMRVAFVEADLVALYDDDTHRNLYDVYRALISKDTGIPVDHILLGSVHDHSAPIVSTKVNPKWTKKFEAALGPTVKRAIAELRPVRIATGQGTSHIGMNRRYVLPADRYSYTTFDENNRSQSFGKFKTDHPVKIHDFAGVVRLGANPGGSMDPDVQLIRIDDGKGPYALMVYYACHGTVLGGRNGKISGDWMGRMDAYIESQIPGVHVIYIQGAAGDINPRIVGGLDGNVDSIQTTYALGDEIGREVVRVYRTLTPQPLVNTQIQLMHRDIPLPLKYRLLAKSFLDPAVHAPTTMLRIGGRLMWVTFPGEMFSSIGKWVKTTIPAQNSYFMGYTNGAIGYFPTQKAFSEGGYETASSDLAPVAEQIYKREMKEFVRAFMAKYPGDQ